jgi:RNA recognition motif-containing protein
LASGIEPQVRYNQDGSRTAKGLVTPRSVTDTKSIFVGNLPESVTKEQLMSEFENFGTIVDANVIHKSYPGGTFNVFGFVEFTTPIQANAAVAVEKYIGENKLRIEPKEYSARRASRFNHLPATPPIRPPRRISPSANVALAMRLLENNVENSFASNEAAPPFIPPTPAYGYNPEEWQTPHHYIPAHLFSPSPASQIPPYFGMPGGDAYYYGGQ